MGANSTTLSNAQLGCTYLSAADPVQWCCGKDQTCTSRTSRCRIHSAPSSQLTVLGQFNICWNLNINPLVAMNETQLNLTYSAMSSANPSLTAYTVPQATLRQMVLGAKGTPNLNFPSIGPATVSASPSASASTTPSTSSSATPGPGGMSGGAKGGIAGGVIGGIALLGVGIFLYWRRRKAKNAEAGTAEEHFLRHELHHEDVKPYQTEGTQILELSRNEKPVEMEHPPVELEATERSHVPGR